MNVNQSVGNSSFQPFLNTNKKSEEKSEKPIDGLFASMIEVSVSEEKVSKIKGKEKSDDENSGENPLELPLDLLSHFDGNIKKLLKSDIVKDLQKEQTTKPIISNSTDDEKPVELLIKDGKLSLDLEEIPGKALNSKESVETHTNKKTGNEISVTNASTEINPKYSLKENHPILENTSVKEVDTHNDVQQILDKVFPELKSSIKSNKNNETSDNDQQLILKTSRGLIFINEEDAKKFDLKSLNNNSKTERIINVSDKELLSIASKLGAVNSTKEKVQVNKVINPIPSNLEDEYLSMPNKSTDEKVLINKEIKTLVQDKNNNLKDNSKLVDFIKTQKIDIDRKIKPNKKVLVEDHPKTKIIKESTDQLLTEHKRFINNLKQKAGIEVEVKTESNLQESSPKSEVQKFHRNFFDSLLNDLHKEKIVKSKDISSESAINTNSSGIVLSGGEINTENNKSQQINSVKNLESKLSLLDNQKIEVGIEESQIENKHTKKSNQAQESRIFNRIKANEFVAKTSQTVRSLAPNGQATARFHLTPETLGKVFVEINVKSNIATLNIKADNKEVVKLIEKQIGNLIDKLQLSGIQTETVNVSQSDFENASGSKEGNQGQRNQERETREEYLESLKTLKKLKDSNEKRILHGGNNA